MVIRRPRGSPFNRTSRPEPMRAVSAAQPRCNATRRPGQPRFAACGRSPGHEPRSSVRCQSSPGTRASTIGRVTQLEDHQQQHDQPDRAGDQRQLSAPVSPSDARGVKMAYMSSKRPAPARRRSVRVLPCLPRGAGDRDCSRRYAGQCGPRHPRRARPPDPRPRAAGVRGVLRRRLAARLAGRGDPVLQDPSGRRGRR